MKEIKYVYGKFKLTIKIPVEIELFIKAIHLNKKDIFDKDFWQMQVEDNVFFSHESHPTESGYVSHSFDEPLSVSKDIKVLLHGIYLNSKKILEFKPTDFEDTIPITTCSCNLKSGPTIYYSFYD